MKKIITFLFLILIAQLSLANSITAIQTLSPGGGLDAAMLHLQKYLQEKKNMKIVFSYKPGGDSLVGLRELNNSPKNGSVIGFTTISGLSVAVNSGLEFEYVSATRKYAQVLIAKNDINVSDYNDLLKKINQGINFNYGSSGPAQVLQYEQIIQFGKLQYKPNLIPYKGAGQLINDLLGGHLDLAMIPINVAKEHINSGKIKILALSMPVDDYKNIPVLSKLYPKWKDIGGYGIVFPYGTDQKIVNEWRLLIKEYLEDPRTIKDFINDDSEAYPSGEKFLKNFIDMLK